MVTGRRGVEQARESGKYKIRVEITWKYPGNSAGMPDEPTSMVMEAVQEALTSTFDKDPVAILTGIYTGDNERNWIFYTTSVHIFEKKINVALAPFDLLRLPSTPKTTLIGWSMTKCVKHRKSPRQTTERDIILHIANTAQADVSYATHACAAMRCPVK